jgi:general secretion pathway protein G
MRNEGNAARQKEGANAMNGNRKRRAAEAGFSLVELMVVISILGLLSSVVAVAVLKNKGKASTQKALVDIKAFDDAIILYHNDTNQYPNGLEDLIQGTVEGWDGPYIKGGSKNLIDPWKRPYAYQFQGGSGDTPYTISSYGRDGAPGGQGEDKDVSNQDSR